MNYLIYIFVSIGLFSYSCKKATEPVSEDKPTTLADHTAYRTTKTISYNGISVDVIIDKPALSEVDVLMVFHGTVGYDSLILEAAENTLNGFTNVLDRDDMMIVSVAYPEEGLLFGDNIAHCEAALLWLKNKANEELNISVEKIFLAGHSQGGYLVTRLNKMHKTNGVIANAPGPLNLYFRCELEENEQISPGLVCTLLAQEYGVPSSNPDPYLERSLLNYTSSYLSDILFIQGMEDSPIQMYSWPTFKEEVEGCTDCQLTIFLEIENMGHNSLFHNLNAKETFNEFISLR